MTDAAPPPLHAAPLAVDWLASGDALTALAASDRTLVAGTAAGAVHVLDVDGNEVRGGWRGEEAASASAPARGRRRPRRRSSGCRGIARDRSTPPPTPPIRRARPRAGPVAHLSLDARSEVVAAAYGGRDIALVPVCGGGGGGSAPTARAPFAATLVALAPDHASPRGGGRLAVAGPCGGVALLGPGGWLGRGGARSLAASGASRGPVLALAWGPADLLAWATPAGVTVHDVAAGVGALLAPRPRLAGPGARAALAWGPAPAPSAAPGRALDLAVSWGPTVQCLRVVPGMGDAPALAPAAGPRDVGACAVGGAPFGGGSLVALVRGDDGTGRLVVVPRGRGGGDARGVAVLEGDVDADPSFPLLFAPALPAVEPAPPSRPRQSRLTVGGEGPASPPRPGAAVAAAAAASTAVASAMSAGAALASRLKAAGAAGSGAATPAPSRPPSPGSSESPPTPVPDNAAFYVARGRSLAAARPLAGDALVAWLLEAGRPAAAAAAAAASGSATARATAGDAALKALLAAGDGAAAAAAAPGLLGTDAAAWERAVHAFAAARALAGLAPLLPVAGPSGVAGAVAASISGGHGVSGAPPLPSECYAMALRSLLLRPDDHPTLLRLITDWPPSAVDAGALAGAVAARAAASGVASPPLLDAAAALYSRLGRPAAALDVLLAQGAPRAVGYADAHGLVGGLKGGALAALVAADPLAAVPLLAAHHATVPPGRVLSSLADAAAASGDPARAAALSAAAADYVSAAFAAAPDSFDAPAADAALALLVDHRPADVATFAREAAALDLDAATSLCADRGLHAARAALLARSGDDAGALAVLVNDAKDVASAVALAAARDGVSGDLWRLLVSLAAADGDAAGALLDVGGGATAARLVAALPPGAAVPRLGPRLAAASRAAAAREGLAHGAASLVAADAARASVALYGAVRKAVRVQVEEGREGGALISVVPADGTGGRRRRRGQRAPLAPLVGARALGASVQ